MQMKKIISIALVLIMLVSLCACEPMEKLQGVELPEPPKVEVAEKPAEAEQEQVESSVEEPPVLSEEPEPRVIVNITKTSEEYYDPAEGKQLILDFSYETPFVDISNRDSASNAINEYIAMLDETYCTGNDYGDGADNGRNMLLELATDNFTYAYETGSDINLEMSSCRTVSAERADGAVLSLLYNTYTYTGGDMGSNNFRAYVFDTRDGSLVDFDMLAADSSGLRQRVLETLEYHASVQPDRFPFEINEETLNDILDGRQWLLAEDGLVVWPDKENRYSYIIKYSELAGLMDEKWMHKAFEGEGELSVILQSDFEDGAMEVIDKIVVDEQGEELCLIASGQVRDVTIYSASYSNGLFYMKGWLWYCSEMEDCAVQLQTVIPDGMPDLMISYRPAEGDQRIRLLTQSGEDESLILADMENISAVG